MAKIIYFTLILLCLLLLLGVGDAGVVIAYIVAATAAANVAA